MANPMQTFMPFLYEKDLQNSKKLLNYKFSKQDIICYPNGQSIHILNHGDSFNDLVLIVKLNTSDKVELHKLINHVEFTIGGQSFDKISGVFLNVLLKHYKLHAMQTENILIIPIPMPLILRNSVVFSCESLGLDKRFKVMFNTPVQSYELRVTYYMHQHNQELKVNNTEFKTFLNNNKLGQIYNFFQYDIYDFSNGVQVIDFNFPSSHMFFTFTDQNNNIIKDKTFTEFTMQVNGQDTIVSTHELLKYDTLKKYGKFEGYYYVNLENFEYNLSHTFDTMINFSYIDHLRLKINPIQQFKNSGLKLHVGSISYNCLRYENGGVGIMYNN